MWNHRFSSFSARGSQRRRFWEARFPAQDEVFHRHRLLPGWDQGAVGRIKLLIVGAGALGGWFGDLAVRMGPEVTDILDYDRVEASNLPRQPFKISDINRGKAPQLGRRLAEARTRRETRVNAYGYSLEQAVEAGMPMDYNAAFVGVDSDPTRLFAARLFQRLGIPAIFAGTGHNSQKGYVFLQRSTTQAPCLACMNPAIEKSEVKEGCFGAAADVPAVLAGVAIYALESLFTQRQIEWDYWEIMLVTGKSVPVRVAKKQNCPVCGGQ
jgi:molybdopterin/thiamine biosynthesis adenylyltransferase